MKRKFIDIAGTGRIPIPGGRPQKEERSSSLENPSTDLMTALGAYDAVTLPGNFGPSTTTAVNPETALTFTAVYACVKVIAESLASLPFHLYKKEGNSRIQVDNDVRAFVLNEQPNPEMDSMLLWETLMGHCLLWGNGYLYKVMDQNGLTTELWPLIPSRTDILRLPDNSIAYRTVLESGEQKFLVADEVVHLKAFGTGTYGISPIGAARRAIGIGISGDEYAGRFFQNDAQPGGIISVDKQMSDEQFNNFKARWQAGHQGLSHSNVVGILTNGMTWNEVGVNPRDGQFIEQRKWQALDVCRAYRVQPHKAGFVEPGAVSYASVEEFNSDFVTDTIRPWATRLEKAVNKSLFSSEPDRMKKLYSKIQLGGLLRGNMQARSAFYSAGITAGWLLKNEVRELEDLPEIPGLDDPPDEPVIAAPAQPENEVASEADTNGNGTIHPDVVKKVLESVKK